MSANQIRPANLEDGDSIQKLAVQLGYNPTKETVLAALQTMQSNPDLQVAAIVTEETHRGMGLGRQLMQYAESKAKESFFFSKDLA